MRLPCNLRAVFVNDICSNNWLDRAMVMEAGYRKMEGKRSPEICVHRIYLRSWAVSNTVSLSWMTRCHRCQRIIKLMPAKTITCAKIWHFKLCAPVPVAARSKALVCGRSFAEIVDSNLTESMDVSLVSAVCCQVEISTTSWSLVQRSPADCDASCVI